MALSQETSQHLTEIWTRENPGLKISLWLEKGKDEGLKILSLRHKPCIKSKVK